MFDYSTLEEKQINKAKPHTVKKFELLEAYAKGWVEKILSIPSCNGVIFIDCMSNNGVYKNIDGEFVEGTPIRIAKLLNTSIVRYTDKDALLFFNDITKNKIDTLKTVLDEDSLTNVTIDYSVGDANSFLNSFIINKYNKYHILLLYDPYQATINWKALSPFLKKWCDIIINHMVSDTIRGLPQAKKDTKKEKYANTYKKNIDDLISLGSDRESLENIIEDIIRKGMVGKEEKYIASSPFYNTKNILLYNLVLCTGNSKAFDLFKNVSWKTFEGKSSLAKNKQLDGQFEINLSNPAEIISCIEDGCYSIGNIADFLYAEHKGKGEISNNEVYIPLRYHPIFPAKGFLPQIKKVLKSSYNVECKKSTMVF